MIGRGLAPYKIVGHAGVLGMAILDCPSAALNLGQFVADTDASAKSVASFCPRAVRDDPRKARSNGPRRSRQQAAEPAGLTSAGSLDVWDGVGRWINCLV
jgi:hypothetical protein